MTFKSGWITDVQHDFQDTLSCINFIITHLLFVPGTPLPCHFNLSLLHTSLQSMEQARNIHTLAIVAMRELVAFINQWHVTVGPNWASNFSLAVRAFIQRIQLTHLPMRGGVFDVDNRVHRFFIHRAMVCGCPMYLLNTKSGNNGELPHPVNEALTNSLLPAGISLNEMSGKEETPDLWCFVDNLDGSDPSLQPIQQVRHVLPPLYILPQSAVFLDIDGWRAIPVPK